MASGWQVHPVKSDLVQAKGIGKHIQHSWDMFSKTQNAIMHGSMMKVPGKTQGIKEHAFLTVDLGGGRHIV